MSDTKKVKVSQLLKREMSGYLCSRLILNIEGSGIDYSIVNGLRRVVFDDIPIYAYDPKTIDIEFNDSIYNNDMMELRLSSLPIFDIKNEIVFLSRKYYENIDFTDPKRERHPDEKKIETYINVHNDTLVNIDVTTDSVKTFVDGKQIKDPYKKTNPILLVKLRPNQAFKARLKCVLNIGETNNIYAGASNVFYKEEKDNGFKFTIESQGQMDEYELLYKGCKILIKKLEDVYENVSKNFKNVDSNNVHIDLINEDYTIGNIVKEGLQEHKDVVFAGASKPDKQIKEIILKYTTATKDKLKPLKETIYGKIDIFKDIQKQLYKLGEKYINS